ncbi:glycosyltransferase family 2 protein [Patescibacteria group bacterium]
MTTFVVVPAFNEEQTIGEVVRLLRPYADHVLVVDDGSSDRSGVIASEAGAHVITHVMNRGLGAALGTGISEAFRRGADAVVTFDADGQHRAEDVPRMVAPIDAGGADVVIGCRTDDRARMPAKRRFANWCGNALTFVLFGIWVKDSQSGLRAFSRYAGERMELKCDRMEVSSEIVKEIKRNGFRLEEIPIVPIYTEYSLSKGQSFVVGLKTAGKLLIRRIMQ